MKSSEYKDHGKTVRLYEMDNGNKYYTCHGGSPPGNGNMELSILWLWVKKNDGEWNNNLSLKRFYELLEDDMSESEIEKWKSRNYAR